MTLEISMSLFVAAGIIAAVRWLHPAVFSVHALLLVLAMAVLAGFIAVIRRR